MHTIESFEKLKADEMRAHLAERGIKVPSKATKAVMVEAFRAATTSAGQVEAPSFSIKTTVTDEEVFEAELEQEMIDHPSRFDLEPLVPLVSVEPDPLDSLVGFVEMRERSHEPKFDTLVLDQAPSLEPPVPPEGLGIATVEDEPQKQVPMNRKQRRRAAALSDNRNMRKARALDLRG